MPTTDWPASRSQWCMVSSGQSQRSVVTGGPHQQMQERPQFAQGLFPRPRRPHPQTPLVPRAHWDKLMIFGRCMSMGDRRRPPQRSRPAGIFFQTSSPPRHQALRGKDQRPMVQYFMGGLGHPRKCRARLASRLTELVGNYTHRTPLRFGSRK